MSPITPTNLRKLSLCERLRLTLEVLWSYSRVRWVMRDEDAERAVHRLRTGSGASIDDLASEVMRDRELLAAWRLAHATGRVLKRLPADSRCLFSALTVLCLLERRGISQSLVVAVRPRPFAAHAWIEVCGRAILPEADAGYERLLEL